MVLSVSTHLRIPAKSEVIGGRYELLNPIGHGGMGTVYRALQRPIDREVAIKVLRRKELGEDGPRAVKRFFKEAKAIASLHHPHIIALYDFGQDDNSGDLYLVMELLPGRSLGELMHQEGPLPLRRAVTLLDQVLEALQEAHKSGIVHRDLKPDNIQVGKRGDREDYVTMLDFGIARRTDVEGLGRPDSTTIEVCGTPAYMSPEQILGTAIDPRSDLYACGVLLFEMITGRLPFDSERTIDMYIGHLKHQAPRLATIAPPGVVVPGLQEFMDRALAKSAEDRIASASSFRRALRSIAGLSANTTNPTVATGTIMSAGYELVAMVDPERAPGMDDLLQQWALDIAEHGGSVREKSPGCLVASFAGCDEPSQVIQTALILKQRTRAQRLATLRPMYVRVGIHQQPSLAKRMCEEAPRGGVVIGADCIEAGFATGAGKSLRMESAGEFRMRGQRKPVKMMQVIPSRG